jgi:hypothetical protein
MEVGYKLHAPTVLPLMESKRKDTPYQTRNPGGGGGWLEL